MTDPFKLQHQVETYKSLISISLEAYKYLALVNGGAAVALLSYAGSSTKINCATPALSGPMAFFLTGLVSCGIGMFCAYMTQLKLHDEGIGVASRGSQQPWLVAAGTAYLGALVAFTVGCWAAIKTFS